MKNNKGRLFWGWISFGVSFLLFLGTIVPAYNYQRDYAIDNLLSTGKFVWLVATIILLLTTNLFTILACLVGYFSWKKSDNQYGKVLLRLSLVLFCISSIRQLMPSDPLQTYETLNIQTISIEDNIFKVNFDRPIKKRVALVGGAEWIVFETADEKLPYLRAEFSKKIDEKLYVNDFSSILKNFATLANIKTPEITVGDSGIGKKGTYQGLMLLEDKPLRILGNVYIRDNSAVHLMVGEPLTDSLSDDAVKFLLSVSKTN